MRRVAMLALTIGLTLTGIGGAAASTGHAAGPAAVRWLGPVPAKTVSYGGYRLTVPAGWPVYRLGPGSVRCVRYDRHAVYLGQPGADQLCPAHLAGRVDTISVQPGGQPGGQPGYLAGVWQAVPAAAAGGGRRQAAQLLMDAQDHQVLAPAARSGLTVSATYASSPALVDRIIASIRPAGTWAAGTGAAAGGGAAAGAAGAAAGQAAVGQAAVGQAAVGQAAVAQAAVTQAAVGQAGAGQGAVGQGAVGQAAVGRAAAGLRGELGRGQYRGLRVRWGFDTCAAPSLRAMSAWRARFSALAIYIGGPEAACGWGNLSPSWVRAVTGMGWALIPTYVGRQAPCSTMFRVRIQLRHAYAEGRAAAGQAMRLAAALGLGPHAPLYDDMEYYHHQRGHCRSGVLSFLNGWTRQLHASGHRAGVYSSAGAAVVDLAASITVYGHRLAKPDSLWFALWDQRPDLGGLPYLQSFMWPAGHRIKQWRGPHRRQIGGIALNIDSDLVAGAVYR